jgi:hypothetical protein
MENIIVSRYFLEKILFDFNDYSISDFENSKEIDIESFLFFKRILFENKAHLYLDISEEDIFRFKSDNVNKDEERDIAKIIKSLRDRIIGSKQAVYDSLSFGRYEDVVQDNLPCFLLLGDATEKKCIEIENAIGINCYSLKRLKVKKEFRNVSLYKLKNTRSHLFNKINQFNYHTIEIDDPYFSSNKNMKRGEISLNIEFIKLLKINTQKRLNLRINTKGITVDNIKGEFDKYRMKFEEDVMAFYKNNGVNFICKFTNDSKHDRYINTNTMLNIIGNSIWNDTETHLTCYPKILYGDYKFEKENT